MLPNDYEQIGDLTPVQIECIRLWCKQLTPIKNINYRTASYRLKHLCELDLGFYVPNGIIKQIMVELGYTMVDKHYPNSINEHYNVSQNSIKTRSSCKPNLLWTTGIGTQSAVSREDTEPTEGGNING